MRAMIEKGPSQTRVSHAKVESVSDGANSAGGASFTTAKAAVAESDAKPVEALPP
jgi:hypothetical protein